MRVNRPCSGGLATASSSGSCKLAGIAVCSMVSPCSRDRSGNPLLPPPEAVPDRAFPASLRARRQAGSFNSQTGTVVSRISAAIPSITVRQGAISSNSKAPPPPRIRPMREPVTWMALPMLRSPAASRRTASPSVETSCVAPAKASSISSEANSTATCGSRSSAGSSHASPTMQTSEIICIGRIQLRPRPMRGQ